MKKQGGRGQGAGEKNHPQGGASAVLACSQGEQLALGILYETLRVACFSVGVQPPEQRRKEAIAHKWRGFKPYLLVNNQKLCASKVCWQLSEK
ncbi:MAG: hypothetical protein MET45_16500 [Nostoc sp. LLA-1]|nr:hypothetical protein [Cyanocohniella sp. LLY]